MDFLSWWFDTHYILSTLLTPATTWVWLIYQDGSGWREAVCILVWLLFAAAK